MSLAERMNDTTMAEALRRKLAVSEAIGALLNEFSHATGLTVTDVRIDSLDVSTIGSKSDAIVYDVELQVKL